MQGRTSSETPTESKPTEPVSPQSPSQQKSPAGHLYEAVSTQRDQVLGAFDSQRAAILKAVADQREAAIAPVRSVRARQSAQSAGRGAAMQGLTGAPLRRQTAAVEIALTLKAMVADEVRAQLVARLGDAAPNSANVGNVTEPGRG